jgi:SulP family sulfate permease
MNISYLSRNDFPTTRSDFRDDLIAGVTVSVVALPLALGFAVTTGMPPSAGLTTAILAGFLAALFGGSRYQVSGPTGAMTVVLIPIVSKYGIGAIPALGLIAGMFVAIAAALRLGTIINRVPWAVVEGFTVGIACVIALQQIPLALEVAKGDGDRTVIVAWNTVAGAIESGINWRSLSVVALTLIVKFYFPKILRRINSDLHIPASIVAIASATIFCKALSLDVHVIGEIPKTIAVWAGKSVRLEDFSHLIWPAFLIAILAAVESLLSARVADGMVHAKQSERYQPNKELFGQGIATIVASLFGGMPATGAIARTSVNVRSHAKTRVAAMVHAFVLLLVVLLFSPLVSAIPTAAIAGVLIGTSYRILNPSSLRESLQTTKSEALVLIITALVTLFVDLIWGIAVGIIAHFIANRINRRI